MYIYLNEVSICKLRTSSMEISTYLRLLLKLQNWEQLMLVHNLFRTGRHIHYGWAKAGRPAVFRSSTRRREGRKFNGMLAQSLGSRGVSLTRDWNVIPSTCLLGTCRSYTHTRASTHARTGTHARTHGHAQKWGNVPASLSRRSSFPASRLATSLSSAAEAPRWRDRWNSHVHLAIGLLGELALGDWIKECPRTWRGVPGCHASAFSSCEWLCFTRRNEEGGLCFWVSRVCSNCEFKADYQTPRAARRREEAVGVPRAVGEVWALTLQGVVKSAWPLRRWGVGQCLRMPPGNHRRASQTGSYWQTCRSGGPGVVSLLARRDPPGSWDFCASAWNSPSCALTLENTGNAGGRTADD